MLLVVPTERRSTIASYKDLIPSQVVSMPEWMDALIKVSHFVHFFRGEMRLPASTLAEIHGHTKSNILQTHLENIVVIRNIPADHETYTRKWFVRRLFDLF